MKYGTALVSGAFHYGLGSLGVLGSQIPTGSSLDLPGKISTVEYRPMVTQWPTGGTFVLLEDGSFSYTGLQDYFDYRLVEDGIENTTDVGFGPGIVRVMLLVGASGFMEGNVALSMKTISGTLQTSNFNGDLTLGLKGIFGTFATGVNFSGGLTLSLKDISGGMNLGDGFSGNLNLFLKQVVGVLGTSSEGRITKIEFFEMDKNRQYMESSSFWLAVSTKNSNGALVVPTTLYYRILCLTNNLVIRPQTLLNSSSTFELEITDEENALIDRKNIREFRRVILTAEFGTGSKIQQKYDFDILNLERTA